MYNYIFWVLYNRDLNRRKKSKTFSRYDASLIVFFTLLVHIAFILEIIKKFFFGFFESLHLDYLTNNKGFEVLLFALLIFLVYKFYTENRIKMIVNKYSGLKWNPTLNGIIVLVIIFLPLILLIIMGWKH